MSFWRLSLDALIERKTRISLTLMMVVIYIEQLQDLETRIN
ncbi:MAG: hypothetical protein ACXAEU_14050 [Candidatus Hodarchaeales archaeon]